MRILVQVCCNLDVEPAPEYTGMSGSDGIQLLDIYNFEGFYVIPSISDLDLMYGDIWPYMSAELFSRQFRLVSGRI